MSAQCYRFGMSPARTSTARAQSLSPSASSRIRTAIRWSQHELSRRTGVSQSTISRIEAAKLDDVPLGTVAVLLEAMGGRLRVEAEAPFLGDRGLQIDPAHARMSGYVTRRLERCGWRVATEVEVGGNRSRGWIDVLAFSPATRNVLVIELKTDLHNLGAIDRTLGWYEREAWFAARRLGWRPSAVVGSLLLLMTDENDATIRFNRAALRHAFPARSPTLTRVIEGSRDPGDMTRGLAMIDPHSKRRAWIRPTVDDGRRSRAPYVDYADFMRALKRR